ncbi:enoyl-CoA hydratase/isomerase family protein [Psychrobacillus lasiicapitis]|uniref:Enoyl-CoA hydratase n=1 Tax=Psychrobacillus lasiicapitis TaxID=1636719 RepID=A0A544THH8_9BACI|nr:enoyl-CoA hydratase-related protein [Psychrobacillus lasiicapitis]TQR16871.1 enoyl-CoA hydratase [Psychrobacillus lasiicapitis]GGA26484.1 enoyl-CoA hydratase [Psychrobacillus lasiicapitis]
MSNNLYVEKNGAIATLIFNRAEKKNSFSLAMFKQLGTILEELQMDSQVKVLILKGVDETAFSAGADISEFLENRFSARKAKDYNDATLESIEKLYRFTKPTIALIKTLAIGGGLELANSCDFRFATAGSKLGITAANIGIIYNLTSTKRLVNLVGPSKAKELLYTAKLIRAEEGKEIGLIDYVYEMDEIEEKCLEFAGQIIRKSSVANNGIKQVIQSIIDGENAETKEIEQLILDSFSSEDYKEGIAAFLEKRKPNFS